MRTVLQLIPRRQAALAVLLGTGAVLTGTLLLATSGALITGASLQPESLLVLLPMITGVRLFAISRASLRYAERLVAHDLTLRLVGRLRTSLLERLVPLAPAALVGARGGDLLARLRTDVDELQGVFVRLVAPTAVAVLAGGIAVGLSALVSPPTALVLAVLLLVLGVAVPLATRRLGADAAVATARAETAVGSEVLDLVRGLADHLSSDGGRTALATLQTHLARQEQAERRTARLTAFTTLAREGVPALGVVAAMWLVGADVVGGTTNPVLLAATALGVLGAFEAVGGLGQAWAAGGRIRAAADRVQALGDQAPAVTEPTHPLPLPAPHPASTRTRPEPVEEPEPAPTRPELVEGPEDAPDDPSTSSGSEVAPLLSFADVALTYPDATGPALDGFSLTVTAGEKVALTGPSGAGKSSLLALALRARDPDRGRVALQGVDLRRLALDDVRSRSAWAPQAPQLLGGSLAGNLRLSRSEASDAELEAALTDVGLAGLLDGVGLHGWIGESGSRLSAGERARVALARALLSPAPLLLLDEPTAHLDQASADQVLDLLVRSTRTVLLVTHSPEVLDHRWRVVRLAVPAPPLLLAAS